MLDIKREVNGWLGWMVSQTVGCIILAYEHSMECWRLWYRREIYVAHLKTSGCCLKHLIGIGWTMAVAWENGIAFG